MIDLMKILCVIDSLGSGGAQRQLVNLAVGFKEKGHDVSFLVYHDLNFFEKVLVESEISIYKILETRYFVRFLKIRRFIRHGNFDAVLSFLEASNLICELSGFPYRKWKLVVGERSANPKILKSFKLKLFRWFHIASDYVVFNSKENLDMVKRVNPFLKDDKCHVIYNIIDFEKWRPKHDYQFRKNGKLHIIVVASHQYLKNLNGLVEGVSLLNETEKSQLIINWVGGRRSDNSKEEAIQKIKKYGLSQIFSFNDPTHDIAKMVQEADILGLFSFYEGLPNVVCEAMATGKVVIASNISDIPYLIKDNQLLCDPYSKEDICRVLRYALTLNFNEVEKISNRNVKNAIHLFNKKDILEKYVYLLTH